MPLSTTSKKEIRMKQQNLQLKKIKDQVMVITGASSGIGLATALMAAKKGAKLVLASRNLEDLENICQQIQKSGGQALAVKADVSKIEDMRKLRDQAIQTFGRIDTWVNNAGVSIYGTVLDTPTEEARQLFDTNFWGIHYGCLMAIEAMANNQAGVIINLGSEVSERSIALQTMYSASKHAVKAYTEGLRTEIEKQNFPIGLTLVRPAGIDTPYTEHAANHLADGEPSLPAPVYHPDVVATAILQCAETPKRDVFIGGASKFFSTLEHIAPRLIDYMVELRMMDEQKKGTNVPHTLENEGLMHAPSSEGKLQGGHKGHVAKSSLWTTASLHPVASLFAIAGVGFAALAGVETFRQTKRNTRTTDLQNPDEMYSRNRIDSRVVTDTGIENRTI
jgi:short-subunit dehydrogenase